MVKLKDLNPILDDHEETTLFTRNGEGNEFTLVCKSKVDYFNKHGEDSVSFVIRNNKGKIEIWTEEVV